MIRLLPLLLGFACIAAPDSAPARPERHGSYTATPTAGLPEVAPGVALLATLDADNHIEVSGTVQATLWEDVDGAQDSRYAFRAQVLSADGTVLYERSTSGPVIVREFLAYYSESSGYDILRLFPELGSFVVQVPLLEGGASVALQLRNDDGTYATAGTYDLARVAEDDQGVLDTVVATETLHDGGDPKQALDVVILGDGYTEAELPSFHKDAETVQKAILAAEPYASWAERISVHRVDVPSVESGASYDCVGECRYRDTAFQSLFPLEIVNALLHTSYRTIAVFQRDQFAVARAASHVAWDLAIVLVNTGHEGGFTVHYATASADSSLAYVAVHEFSHLMGQLGDEYVSDACIRSDALGLPANISESADSPPWIDWVEADTPLPTPSSGRYADAVGTFAGAYNCSDLYRPQQSCLMASGASLCAVCAEQITRRIFRYGDAAAGGTATPDGAGGYVFSLDGADAAAKVTWTLDGEAAATGASFALSPKKVAEGAHELVGTATVHTPWVRADEGDLSTSWRWSLE